MKPAALHPRSPYRNDAVFRSAELLISSVPKKPARKLASRPVIFAVGIVCGLGLAVLLVPRVREALGRVVAFDEAPAETSESPRSPSPFRFAQPQDAATAPIAPGRSITAVDTAPASAPRRRSVRAASPASNAEPNALDRDLPAPKIVITPYTTRLRMKGELRSTAASATPIIVNFDLRFTPGHGGGLLRGLVQVLDDAHPRLAFPVAGTLFNHTLTLNESPEAPDSPAQSANGYVFVLQLPAAPATGEITGSWTHGTRRGTLLLQTAWAF